MPRLLDCAQGSREWHIEHLGRLSGSILHRLLEGGHRARATLMDEIALERELLDGIREGAEWEPPRDATTGPRAHGHRLEPEARAAYAMLYDCDVAEIGFAVHDELDILGVSPDGLIYHPQLRGLEIKCPWNPEVHARTVAYGMPDKHRAQVQAGMAVFGCERWDFCSYCPSYPDPALRLVVYPQQRDEAYIDRMLEMVRDFGEMLSSDIGPISCDDNIPNLF